MAVPLLAIAFRGKISRLEQWASLMPVFAFWIPTIQFVLFKFSAVFGNPLGPLVTEVCTFYPLLFMSIYLAMAYLDRIDNTGMDNLVSEAGYPIMVYSWFLGIQRVLKGFVFRFSGLTTLLNRVIFQLVAATFYAVIIPNGVFLPSIPSAAFTMIGNVHNPLVRTTEVLNNTLALSDYSLIARGESLTGYVSVLESHKDHFRVLRCDHSLLGGVWMLPPRSGRITSVKEPIYAVFAMLEAVRLIERINVAEPGLTPESALNIGLGIGTAPGALIAHGINTTVIEIDPLVHYYAQKYFEFPDNHNYVIGDAVEVVSSWATHGQRGRYDYIIHDVFTGGAEPAEVFTFEFLLDLSALLKDNGAIVINYAGDPASPITSMIYRTVAAVFPSCRVFRETDPASAATTVTNMAIFCTKSEHPVVFREPIEADFLGSGARKESLPPTFEIPPQSFDAEGELLHRSGNGMRMLKKSQTQSAIEHWRVMRTVLPDLIWENW